MLVAAVCCARAAPESCSFTHLSAEQQGLGLLWARRCLGQDTEIGRHLTRWRRQDWSEQLERATQVWLPRGRNLALHLFRAAGEGFQGTGRPSWFNYTWAEDAGERTDVASVRDMCEACEDTETGQGDRTEDAGGGWSLDRREQRVTQRVRVGTGH